MPTRLGRITAILVAAALLGFAGAASAERIKDIANIAGVRPNQLVGYGLVVGLDGTGDGNLGVTIQSLQSVMSRFGVTVDASGLNPKNAAAVMVTAELPPFAKPGQRIDVTVSTIGKANSLRGGALLMTGLIGADGETYAVAQGNLAVGGLGIAGADGSKVSVNVPTVGRIPGGATVERRVETPFETAPFLMLNLHSPDFSTAENLADAINGVLGQGVAYAIDATSIRVRAPEDLHQRVSFMSVVEEIQVETALPPARVIVNSRTGTIVIGQGVRLMPAAVSHGSLTVRITEDIQVSQPQGTVITEGGVVVPGGETVVSPDSQIDIEQEPARMFLFAPSVELSSIVDAVNAVGASPADLIAILEALKQAGSLKAELIVI